MSKKNNYKARIKVGDYIIYCDICGQTCWASESRTLDTYTGRGGMVVCPNDRDQINWGFVPFLIEPEESPQVIRVNQTNTDEVYGAWDWSLDPMSISSPTEIPGSSSGSSGGGGNPTVGNWEDLDTQTWDAWSTPWGS